MVYAAKLVTGYMRNGCNLRELESSSLWFNRPEKSASLEQSLEDEIYLLRQQMELKFNEDQSLTSKSVIEASSLLDSKINEYMHKISQK